MSTVGVTPEQKQIDHADRHAESMFTGYSDKDRLQRGISHPDYKSRLFKLIDDLGWDPTNLLEKFQFEIYSKFLGFECPDLKGLAFPAHQDGFNWVLPIVAIHDTAPNEAIFQALKKQFAPKENSNGCSKWTDDVLDEVVTKNDRDPLQGPYAIRVRDRQEADEELSSISANQLAERQTPCITLYERQVLEAFYYVETGQHLDVANVTLCAGSRYSNDRVPRAGWNPDRRTFDLLWYSSGHQSGRFRARQVVS